jgi:acyl-CoA thioesterase FadM
MNKNQDSVVRIKVKPEDCDLYGHLNYSKYPEYFKQAGIGLLNTAGIDLNELYLRKMGLFVVDLHIKYVREVRQDRQIYIASSFFCFGERPWIETHQEMSCDGEVIAVCDEKKVFVNLKNNKPRAIPVPEEFLSRSKLAGVVQ